MENYLSKKQNNIETNRLKGKISILCQNDFVWREIAALTRIPKKLIRGIAKGTFILEEQEAVRLQKIFDDLFSKLKIDADDEASQYVETHTYTKILVDVKDVVLHKGTDDNSLVLLIKGEERK